MILTLTLLTFDEDQDYSSIRDTMLLTYNLNTDGYRLKFLKTSPEEDETIHAFINRLGFCLDTSVSLAKVS